MTFGSLFSGCGCFDKGLEDAGMRGVWQCEIEPACLNVLARHWPDRPRCKDVRELHESSEFVRPDWLVGGFPCQDLSVAGRRSGLAGERSGLWWEFHRAIREFAPSGVLIENVPGLLSSWSGDSPSSLGIEPGPGRTMDLVETGDFSVVTDSLSELGYGWAMRVLDAQWFGVPQRRRRVFIVGCLGDWRRAAEILFERNSLPWDSPPSREARARVAASLTAGVAASRGVSRPGRKREDDVNIVGYQCQGTNVGPMGTLRTGDNHTSGVPFVAACLNSGGNNGGFRTEPGEHLVSAYRTSGNCGAWDTGDKVDALTTFTDPNSHVIAHTLRGEGFDASEDGTGRGVPLVAQTLQAKDSRGVHLDMTFIPMAFAQNQRDEVRDLNGLAGSLAAEPGMKQQTYVAYATQENAVSGNNRHGVRRLLPVESERLMGLPDDWTRYGADGKELSDSARYHMIGNGGAVPVLEWIGRRILAATLTPALTPATNTDA